MNIAVLTLFPEMFQAITEHGVTGRAVARGLLNVSPVNPRDFTRDKHRTVDDRPFGGGPGMLMKMEPLLAALAEARAQVGEQARVVYLTPQGQRLDQPAVERLAQAPAMILIAGRYEGIDERFVDAEVDEQWSVGDYVLSGGELPAMVLMDAMARRLPGVLGHEGSAEQDSFSGALTNLLDCPHYTRPVEYAGRRVPDVLLSGHHEAVRRWRLKQALGRTWQRRPELLEARKASPGLSKEEQTLLEEFIREQANGSGDADSGDRSR